MFPTLGAMLGLLHPVAGGVLRRGLKFQTCTNTLNNFLTIPGILGFLPRIPYDDCCVLNVACSYIQLFSVTNSYEHNNLIFNFICTCFVACDTDVYYT